jgi:transcription initiation factor TFIIIB Brf1 subunit/transcription initiation factor TFIIB
MMNEGMLSMFINCGECGREEFEQEWDLENGKTTCEGCKEVVKMLKECEA